MMEDKDQLNQSVSNLSLRMKPKSIEGGKILQKKLLSESKSIGVDQSE
jgi:hypothetical protein